MSKRSQKKKARKPSSQPKKEVGPILYPVWEKQPDWLALGILLILLLVFFSPMMLSDKTLLPPDSVASRWAGPFLEGARDSGVYPLWNPLLFCGMPSYASLTSAPYVDVVENVVRWGIWLVRRIVPLPDFTRIFINYLLFGGAVFLLLRTKKLSPGAAFFASLAMVFMPQVIAYAAFGHNTKLGTVMFVPLIFLLLERLLDRRNLLYLCLMGLAVGLQLLRKHVQICYYTQLMAGIYFVYWAVVTIRNDRKIGRVLAGGGLLLGALLLGVLLSAVLNLSVMEYAEYSIRGGGETGGLNYDYATNWSFPPLEITTYFIPSFVGFGRDTYWGPMIFTDMPLYFGLVVFVLAGLALVVRRNRTTLFFGIFALIVLLVSFGKHLPLLYGPMFKFLPLFSKFRAPKMIQVMLQFSMVILAAFGLQGILDLREKENDRSLKNIRRYLMAFGAVLFLLFFILLVGKNAYLGWAAGARSGPEAAYDRALGDGFKALFFFGVTAAVLWLGVMRRMRAGLVIVLLSGLAFLDYWLVDRQFVEPRSRTEEGAFFRETPDVRFLKEREGPFRILQVADQRPPNWYAYHGIQNVSGYQGAKLRVYQELIDAFGMPNGFLQKYLKVEEGQYVWREPGEISRSRWERDQAFLRLTNVRYIVGPYPIPDPALRVVSPPRVQGQNAVLEYRDALPRAYFPERVVVLEGKEAVLAAMSGPGFDPGRTAIVEEALPSEVEGSENHTARVKSYAIHRVDIEADLPTPGLLVLSDMYYPAGWKAYVDGAESRIYKTNWAFRAVFLEPGSHEVSFRFEPRMPTLGLTISIATLCLLLAGIGLGWVLERKSAASRAEA